MASDAPFSGREDVDPPTEDAALGDAAFQIRVDPASHGGATVEGVPHGGATVEGRAALRELAGALIGRYKLLQKIGEGGFGTVWMAEQREPVVRKVALKIIKLGMDTREVVARFEAERQALALMEHPNIARVLDGGATGSGRPFFVMELVHGVPITQFCDDAGLPVEQRLALFADVCSAIQHAHQKGVIHRDVKPSNILVTLHGDRAVPKVIDFGIAKATQQKLTDKTLFTQFQQFVGTPAYMSPEQASLSGLDIDTRSDIYSLGVLLYELLTGTTPFDSTTAGGPGGFDAVRRAIQEQEPPRPSTRLSTMGGEAVAAVVKRRGGGDAKRLGRFLRGDLDLIVMKALEKDRTRRYDTAGALAADVGRFLAKEPVTAVAPSVSYKVSKFLRRNRAAVAAVGVICGLLVAGGATSTVLAVRATRAGSEARRAAEAAENAKRAEQAERVKAQQAMRAAEAEATNAKRLLAHTGAQYMLREKRVKEAYEQAVAASRLNGNWEDRSLLGSIVDASRAEWALVASVKVAPGRGVALGEIASLRALARCAPGCFAGPGGRYLVVPTATGIDAYAIAEGSRVAGSAATGQSPSSLLAVGDDRVIAAVGDVVRAYTVPDLRPLAEFAMPATVLHTAYDPAQQNFAAASVDGQVRVWRAPLAGRAAAAPLAEATFPVSKTPRVQVDFSPSGDALLHNGGYATTEQVVWDWKTGATRTMDAAQAPRFARAGERRVLGLKMGTLDAEEISFFASEFASADGGTAPSAPSVWLSAKPGARGTHDFLVWTARWRARPGGPLEDDVRCAMLARDGLGTYSYTRRAALAIVQFTSLMPHAREEPRAVAFDGRRGLLALTVGGERVVVFQERGASSAGAAGAAPAWDGGAGRWRTSYWSMGVTRAGVVVGQPRANHLALNFVPFEVGSPRQRRFAWPAPQPGRHALLWGLTATPDGGTVAALWQESSDAGSITATYYRKRIIVYRFDPDGPAGTGPDEPIPPAREIALTDYDGVEGRANRILAITPDGRNVTYSPTNGRATIYRVADGGVVERFEAGNTMSASPDGSLLAGGRFSDAHPVRVWDLASGRVVYTSPAAARVRRAAVSPDNRTLYVAWDDAARMEAIDLASGRVVRAWETRLAPVAISPAGDRFVAFVADGRSTSGAMVVADLATAQSIVVVSRGSHVLNGAVYSGDGQVIASAAGRNEAMMARPATPEKAVEWLERLEPPVFVP